MAQNYWQVFQMVKNDQQMKPGWLLDPNLTPSCQSDPKFAPVFKSSNWNNRNVKKMSSFWWLKSYTCKGPNWMKSKSNDPEWSTVETWMNLRPKSQPPAARVTPNLTLVFKCCDWNNRNVRKCQNIKLVLPKYQPQLPEWTQIWPTFSSVLTEITEI